MKTFISNHKNQSSFITLFVFIPLFFVFLYSKDFLHIQPNESIKENKFNMAIKHFVQNSSDMKPTQPTQTIQEPSNVQPKEPVQEIKKIKPRKEKPIAKPKKIIPPANAKAISQPKKDTNMQQPIMQQQTPQASSYQSVSLTSNSEFLKEIKSAIDEALIYPRQARKMRMSGEVLVEFTWTKEKKLENLKILKPSKYDFLNKSALETIRIASKKFPQYEKTFHIKIPLVYKLS
ncbi:TonB family protein [Campylobacter coli]|uniref:TonB family protein n=1 Tax=Campylobacter coli TaxID=195 RepID=UPI00073F826F|nr:energy transducer TonB [Campylobacter coli]EAK8023278.1 energy transducer TonB [Campylobacter coli]EDO8879013.1 TonB family protein [Campylobacter coli]HEB7547464.1 energy transducer TonB [Campylobacter coli]HED6587693.1 energy transducer TonB [Campylobacter coli]HED6594452.1 energy transducer TonB [Campylobacter coli]